MNKFKICPRCDVKTFFRRRICDACGLKSYENNSYTFRTNKYIVDIFTINTIISSRKLEKGLLYKPIFEITISKQISLKATDQDIDKLLILK